MKILLESIPKNINNRKGIGSSQDGFMKGKSRLTKLLAFYYEVTHLVCEGIAVDVIYLHVRKGFETVSHNIIMDKIKKCRLDKWTAS